MQSGGCCTVLFVEVQMKRFPVLLLMLSALVCETFGAGQSAAKIIDRFKKASGGKSVARVKSTLMTGIVKDNDGTAGRFSLQTSSPNNFRLDLEIGGSKISECY